MPDSPLRRVVLYKHGVGWFERESTVSGSESLVLRFRQSEVSDVMKSLTVLDLDGGIISAVSCDSAKSPEKLLSEIAFSFPEEDTLAGLLPQLRGAEIRIREGASGPVVAGVLLGADRVQIVVRDATVNQLRGSLLDATGTIHTFDVQSAGIEIVDGALRAELGLYLRTLISARRTDLRNMTFFAEGEGERRLSISYVIEAPVWKATYRVLLHDDADAMIQGWAIVDNTTDEDWDKIALSLVAGLPVAFTHDLATPRYIRRPVVAVRETTGVLPPIAEAGVFLGDADDIQPAFEKYESSQDESQSAGGGRMRAKMAAPATMVMRSRSAPSSAPVQTREREVGDLFAYDIDHPVTIRRNQSGMVPIVLKSFAGKSVLLYNRASREQNPMRCVEFKNSTGLTLEGGPLTVHEAGTYAGEAMLDTIKPDEERLLAYAVELSVRAVVESEDTEGDVSRVYIANGYVHIDRHQIRSTHYKLTNNGKKPSVLLIDHPKVGGWHPDGFTPVTETENYYRLRYDLAAGVSRAIDVRLRTVGTQTRQLSALTGSMIEHYQQNRWFDEKAIAELTELLRMQNEVRAIQKQRESLEKEEKAIFKDQQRIRENLGSLAEVGNETTLRNRLLRMLNDQEDRLAAIRSEAVKLEADETKRSAEWNQKLQTMAVG